MSYRIYRNFLKQLKYNACNIQRHSEINFKNHVQYLSTSIPNIEEKKSSLNRNSFIRRNRENDLKPRGDPDMFGNLTKNLKFDKEIDSMPDEEDDVIRQDFVDDKIGKTKLSTKQYADLIKKHLADNKLIEAIDVLEVKMIKEHRVQPENYIYNLLIDGCAKLGYTKKAFKLYNDMKKRDLKVTGATYTSLFNSCALSPVPGDGLKRAHHLREFIIERQVLLNRSNYHSMMKAFGRCGDLVTVFNIVDEMVANNIPVKPDTFCFLLQACVSDKQNGFRHALMVWQKMREKRVKPTIYCYNLMLRCTRDCHIGDPLRLTQDLKLITAGETEQSGNNQNLITAGDATGKLNQNVLTAEDNGLKSLAINYNHNVDVPAVLPNLLSSQPQMGAVVSIGNITKARHRIMLLGGCPGFFNQMKSDNVVPDVKTATLLLDVIPSTYNAELELLETLEKANISLDVDFCNMLIKKRNMRNDYYNAKEVLKLMTKLKLLPNLMTFGVLSLACRSTRDSVQFLNDLNAAGFRPNIEILGGLLCAARHSWNIEMVMMIMDIVEKDEIKVSDIFMNHLENVKSFTEKQIQLKNQGLAYHEKIDKESYIDSYQRFLVKTEKWSKKIQLDTRDKVHPWKQFRKQTPVEESAAQ